MTRQFLCVEDHIANGSTSQTLPETGAYKRDEKEGECKMMRNETDGSEEVGRVAFTIKRQEVSAHRSGDRKTLRASLNFPQAMGPIYWHSELPPLDAEAMGEHIVEATSGRVPGTIAHRDDLWERCYEELMVEARTRLEQEITRLGGSYAHVLSESTDSRHDGATGESWLHGRFAYMLYRQPANE